MQYTCINRKGKQRKSSVRRGLRKNLTKRANMTAVAGNRTLVTCYYGPYTAYIRFRLYIRRICTVGQNPCTVIRIRIWSEISIYSYSYTAYPDTPYFRMYGYGQPYVYHMGGHSALTGHGQQFQTHTLTYTHTHKHISNTPW
jgi:hypothetical protein